MKRYLITYELKNKKRDYSALYETIKKISGYWWHYLDSVWIIKETTLSSQDIYEKLKPLIDEVTDRLYIVEITKNDQGWLPKKAWPWLQN